MFCLLTPQSSHPLVVISQILEYTVFIWRVVRSQNSNEACHLTGQSLTHQSHFTTQNYYHVYLSTGQNYCQVPFSQERILTRFVFLQTRFPSRRPLTDQNSNLVVVFTGPNFFKNLIHVLSRQKKWQLPDHICPYMLEFLAGVFSWRPKFIPRIYSYMQDFITGACSSRPGFLARIC